ncbi:MAG: Gfo/Idh/MocA family oxidoreductase [Planctomycetes bacterium]|nr:Gfo/Idh/MocA family oxidoreductase [Planctomycetota bacterium]
MNEPKTRRELLHSSAALLAAPAILKFPSVRRASRLRVGVIGCGGRGTGAAINAVQAAAESGVAVEIVALADAFADRVRTCRDELAKPENGVVEHVLAGDADCHAGLDSYRKVVEAPLDAVVLATSPHFRPIHLAAAIEAGKHAFMEKPAGVDPSGIRSVLASAELADARRLSIVAGTQRRHEQCYLEAMARIRAGDIGRIVAARCSWNQGGLWVKPRQPEWTDMEWQLRNWLYFTWTSGDHIVEQHVHNLDVVRWALGAQDAAADADLHLVGVDPLAARGMGGRQVRTQPEYGHIFDHFAVEYEFPGNVIASSQCRQIDGSDSAVEEVLIGTLGTCVLRSGSAEITGARPWRWSGTHNPYLQEHVDLQRAIASDAPVNEARQVAHSTLMAVMGRMSAYTGKTVSWDFARGSQLDLAPGTYELGALQPTEVAVPGRTPLI